MESIDEFGPRFQPQTASRSARWNPSGTGFTGNAAGTTGSYYYAPNYYGKLPAMDSFGHVFNPYYSYYIMTFGETELPVIPPTQRVRCVSG